MPALVKAFLEQLARPGTAIRSGGPGGWTALMTGRSARIVVTMGMPAAIYRWYFLSHGLKSLRRNVLRFVGFAPVRQTIIGSVESSERSRLKGLDLMGKLGRRAA
jgi:putative NADPH-quinone reductase